MEEPRARQRSPLIENTNAREEAEHSSLVKQRVLGEYQRALIIMTACHCVRPGEGERSCGEEMRKEGEIRETACAGREGPEKKAFKARETNKKRLPPPTPSSSLHCF